jgi:hypothetical protein
MIIQPMKPVTGPDDLRDRLRAALFNVDQFDGAAFERWCLTQAPIIIAAASARKPNAVYRLRRTIDGTRAHEGMHAIIVGYLRDGRCAVHILEDTETFRLAPHVDLEDLEDVTDALRASQPF